MRRSTVRASVPPCPVLPHPPCASRRPAIAMCTFCRPVFILQLKINGRESEMTLLIRFCHAKHRWLRTPRAIYPTIITPTSVRMSYMLSLFRQLLFPFESRMIDIRSKNGCTHFEISAGVAATRLHFRKVCSMSCGMWNVECKIGY